MMFLDADELGQIIDFENTHVNSVRKKLSDVGDSLPVNDEMCIRRAIRVEQLINARVKRGKVDVVSTLDEGDLVYDNTK